MTLEKEIQDSITKNLPAQVGEVLKMRLVEAEQDKKELEKALKLNDNQAEQIKNLNEKLDKHRDINVREHRLKEREDILKEAETKLEVKTLTYQLEAEKEKVDFTKQIALGLVRNSVYRKTVFDSENQAPYQVPNNMGGMTMVYPININKNLDETQTEE